MNIPFPTGLPLETQQSIVRAWTILRDRTREINATHQVIEDEIDALTASVLDRAFAEDAPVRDAA